MRFSQPFCHFSLLPSRLESKAFQSRPRRDACFRVVFFAAFQEMLRFRADATFHIWSHAAIAEYGADVSGGLGA